MAATWTMGTMTKAVTMKITGVLRPAPTQLRLHLSVQVAPHQTVMKRCKDYTHYAKGREAAAEANDAVAHLDLFSSVKALPQSSRAL